MRAISILFYLLISAGHAGAQTIDITINTSKKLQQIEGFGASDAWSTEVVGNTFSEKNKENAAKWLFSSKLNSKGEKEGIGLSIWRFCLGPFGNMPAGSEAIPQDYLDPNGEYVWNVNPGKQWFLDKALEYGCSQVGAWSACILPQLRTDGMTDISYHNYGNFLADVMKHYNDLGYQFKYIAPVNEPQYDWTKGEVKWTSTRISKMTRAISQVFVEKGINTPILLGEAADWGNLYDSNDADSHWARNQIFNYFNPLSVNYIGDLPNLMKEFGVHSYWTDQSADRIKEFRTKAKDRADQYGISLHQTEWSLLSNPPIEDLPDNPSDMDYALILAKVIHSDLYYAGVKSWTYWEAFGAGSDARYHLIKTDNLDKSYEVRKNLWVLGNYSLFIRPGYQRVELEGANGLRGLMGTAYVSEDGSKLIATFVNMGVAVSANPTILLPDGCDITSVSKYVTSSLYNLQLMPVKEMTSIPIPAKSVTTVVYQIARNTGLKGEQIKKNFVVENNNLHILNPAIEEISLFDLSGQHLCRIKCTEDKIKLDLPAGLYIISVQDGSKQINSKIYVK